MSPVIDEEKMSPGYRMGSVLFLTLLFGWWNVRPAHCKPMPLIPKCLPQNGIKMEVGR